MKKQFITLMAVLGFAMASSAQTKTTLATDAQCVFKAAKDKTGEWVTGMYKSDPIAYDNTKGAIVEVTFKEVSPAQKFRVNVQGSAGGTDNFDTTNDVTEGTVVRVKLSAALDVQQIALQNTSVEGNADGSVKAVFDAVLISDIDYDAETAVETTLINEGQNTAVSAQVLSALGDYDILTVKYNVTEGIAEGHEGWGIGAMCNNTEGWPSLLELSAYTGANSKSFYVADIKAAVSNGIVFNLWGRDKATASVTGVTVQKCKSKVTTPVASVSSDAEVVSVDYYTIAGEKVNVPAQGVNIVVEKLSDGTVRTAKIVKK